MNNNDLLIEIGCEELPPKSLKNLGESLGSALEHGLKEARFSFSQLQWFATPRRLAVLVSELSEKQSDITLVKKGPPVQAAYDKEGNPTKAALGWAKSNGIALEDAQVIETPKGKWLQVEVAETGKNIDSCLQDLLTNAITKLPIAKVMRWGNSNHQFVRPVHNLCCLYGDKVLPISLLGNTANNKVLGHRFHSAGMHAIDKASQYSEFLLERKVVADFETRKSQIESLIVDGAKADNAEVSYNSDLLEEVASLVEWPVLLKAEFDAEFLEVPKEPLIYTMKDDQKYFPLLNKDTGELLNRFYVISNIESRNKQVVVEGNQKVVRPRLADAQFFFNQDLKTKIDTRLNSLKNVVYQKQLGTLYEKSIRIAKLSEALSQLLGLGEPKLAYRAGEICKSDLTSKMVYEFPEVQGDMGTHYALHEGEDSEVANAIRDHYKPKGADGDLPAAPISQVVALAEKLDTLVGIFGIGMLPKGDKDPFALRRAVLGIIKILMAYDIKLNFKEAIALAVKQYDMEVLTNSCLQEDIFNFFNNRLENLLVEQGHSVNMVRSVLLSNSENLVEVKEKLAALSDFVESNTEVVESLVASNKRIANILKKADKFDGSIEINEALFEGNEEKQLFEMLQSSGLSEGSYESKLIAMAKLKDPINNFFDNVMVNAENDEVRLNRMSLLHSLRSQFLTIADFSLIQG